MEEEKSTPFEEWMTCVCPWEYVEQRRKSRLFKKGVHVYDTKVLPVDVPRTEFELRPMSEMLRDFFQEGNPLMYKFGQSADMWIFWSVTKGMYRMNQMKQMFVFQGQSPDILRLKHGSENFWLQVSEHRGFENVQKITTTCNQLYSQILRKFVRCTNRNDLRSNRLNNFRMIEEFVQFQSHRNHEHKKRRWTYLGRTQGGNKGRAKAASSIPHPQHSVHRLLLDYHMWVPTVRKVSRP